MRLQRNPVSAGCAAVLSAHSERALATLQGHRSICLGVGGGTLPALWAARFRRSRMDCVDCDAAIVALSRRLLSLSAPVHSDPLHILN